MTPLVIAGIILLIMFVFYWFKQEHLSDIPLSQMTDIDIDKLRTYIETAVRMNTQFGDFRRMYPYTITPWQYSRMTAMRKRGELTNAAIKTIFINSGETLHYAQTAVVSMEASA